MKLDVEKYNISLMDDDLVIIEGNDAMDDLQKESNSFHLSCFKRTFVQLKKLLPGATKIELYGFDNRTAYFDEMAIYDQDGESTSLNVMAVRFSNNAISLTIENNEISDLLEFLNALEKEHDEYVLKTSNKNKRYYSEETARQAIREASSILNSNTHFAGELN